MQQWLKGDCFALKICIHFNYTGVLKIKWKHYGYMKVPFDSKFGSLATFSEVSSISCLLCSPVSSQAYKNTFNVSITLKKNMILYV